MTTAVFDYDAVIFRSACAVEKKKIKVVNKKNNEELIFKNRTELYGNWRKKEGGWLAKQSGLTLEDLTIEDFSELEPVEYALAIAKSIVNKSVDAVGAFDYHGYVGGKENFRKEICTLLPYKEQRKDLIPPAYKNEVRDYLIKHHSAKYAYGIESDDAIVQDLYANKHWFGIVAEKDFYGCEGNYYNFVKEELFTVSGLGKLYRDDKGSVRGIGRIWKYFQVCYGDESDGYFAACFSDKTNGEVAVYNRLKDCKTDKEAFIAMKEHFQFLYPEPKVITNWRKDTFEIDWLYVLQECFNMAHMLRFENDKVDIKQVFVKQGIEL